MIPVGLGLLAIFILWYSLGLEQNKASTASASNCESGTILSSAARSNVTFSGIVTSIDDLGRDDYLIHIDIDRVWEGQLKIGQNLAIYEYPQGCDSLFQVGNRYLVFARDVTQNFDDPEVYADASTGRVYQTSHFLGTKQFDQAELDILALDFINGNNSTGFSISDTVDGYTYTISGRHTDGLQIKRMEFDPKWGIVLFLENLNGNSLLELSLPKETIDGFTYYEYVIEDYSTSNQVELLVANATHTWVTFEVPQGAWEIAFKGTHVAPEFSSSSLIAMVMIASIVGVSVWSRWGNGSRIKIE